ncbi:MAG: phosphatase PAP2 family protein [Muribaculaceae bacterium]|nr:phosphatase PAP2 family protein [Muribaculaceae bacterium]
MKLIAFIFCLITVFDSCLAYSVTPDSIPSAEVVDIEQEESFSFFYEGDEDSDYPTVSRTMYSFKPTQLILPGALLAAGIVGTYTLDSFKNSVRDHISGYKAGRKFKVDEYVQYLPVAGYIGMGFIPGIKTRSNFRQRLMAGVTAYAVMAVTVNAMKYTFKHPRPDSGQRNSFPSGHSATAFTGAELMRIEYGNYIGCAGYAVALTVGMLRIYNDRHWITDVFGGAAIGILSARVGYWLMPLEQKLFKLDKNNERNKSLAILPMLGETNGMALSLQF